jgi:hypothetical protein
MGKIFGSFFGILNEIREFPIAEEEIIFLISRYFIKDFIVIYLLFIDES